MHRLGILGSTRGTDMLPLIMAIQQKRVRASIEVVISNKENAVILDHARKHKLRAEFLDPTSIAREAFDEKISNLLQELKIDLVILIGYMRILSNAFIAKWRNKIINVHPSLLPAFAGAMDNNVHQAVLDSGVKETGCTVHYVTEEVDLGPILLQKKCMVMAHDTVESLKARVQELEGEALIEVVQKIVAGNC